MDQRLFNAARLGDIVTLDTLLEQDPMILERVSLAPVPENPMLVAALAGQTSFVRVMLKRMPSFAWERDKDGFSPLHMASARGHIDVVRELLMLSPDLCLLKDKNGVTPLHFAAIQERIVVIRELLAHCPQAIDEVTARGETALHLAVKNNRFEALKILVEFLNNNHHQELIQSNDKEGHNILDLAKASDQRQVLHLLHGEDDNSTGRAGLEEAVGHTEGNLSLEHQGQRKHQEIEEVSDTISGQVLHLLHGEDDNSTGRAGLEEAVGHTEGNLSLEHEGQRKHQEVEEVSDTISQASPTDKSDETCRSNLKDKDPRRFSSDARNACLVLAVLIATETYQAAMSPPASMWKEDMSLDLRCMFQNWSSKPSPHSTRVCPASSFYLFICSNTFAFVSSILIIFLALNGNNSATTLLSVSLLCMMLTYGTLLVSISSNILSLLTVGMVAFVITIYFLTNHLYIKKALLRKVPTDKVTFSSTIKPLLGHSSYIMKCLLRYSSCTRNFSRYSTSELTGRPV